MAAAEADKAVSKLFDTAPGQKKFPKPPDLQRGFQKIVKDLFAEGYDVVEEWNAVRDALVVKGPLTPESLKAAANHQEAVADRAHRLAIVAKIEVKQYMRETDAIMAAVRSSATESLEAQKAKKLRTKQITDADVVAEAARLHPDEWSDVCSRREKAEAMVRQIENLAQLARSRCYTISNMASPGNRGV